MTQIILGFFAFILICLSVHGLIREQQRAKKHQLLSSLLNPDKVKHHKKKIDKNTVTDTAFGKMVAKNHQLSYFLGKFENNFLWKIYAVVTLFSVFVLLNRIFSFINLDQSILVIILFVTVVAVIIIPGRISHRIVQKRVLHLANDVPMLVDMLAIMIQSGMTIENAIRFTKDRFAPINRDMATVLERACFRMDVNGINSALTLIYEEVPCKEMKMLCSTLQQSVNYGSSIYQILLDLATEIRELQILETEEKIAAASAKMTLPMMLFILFPILVVVAAPVIIKLTRLFS